MNIALSAPPPPPRRHDDPPELSDEYRARKDTGRPERPDQEQKKPWEPKPDGLSEGENQYRLLRLSIGFYAETVASLRK